MPSKKAASKNKQQNTTDAKKAINLEEAVLKNLTLKNYHGLVPSLNPQDKRIPFFLKQLQTNGFDTTEVWNLNKTIASFILPRLILFRENNIGYPHDLTFEKWNKILDKMIVAFNFHCSIDDEKHQERWQKMDAKKQEKYLNKVEKGMALFARYFMHLWY